MRKETLEANECDVELTADPICQLTDTRKSVNWFQFSIIPQETLLEHFVVGLCSTPVNISVTNV
jgi:hypothetical protein